MSEKRISAEEFIKRCNKTQDMFIGRLEGMKKCKELINRLQFQGFIVEFLDNEHQENYSPNLWIKPTWRNYKGVKRFTIDADTTSAIVRLRPDEFSLESDGSFRMWWD